MNQTMLAIFTPENILAFILISGFAVLFHTRWDRQSVAIGPTILTTLGIFFCFLGIAIGLLNFDANDVKGSLPALLQGIRTAFWASVWGIGMALTIKARRAFGAPPALKEGQSSGATINDLVDQITKLNKSIAGEDDSTLISQIKLSRSDSNERLTRLQTSFDNFVKVMAEANSKALIEALSNIIQDFNTQLREQFGENFKQLNAAVEKLVIWQAQYKDQLTDLISQETTTRESMKVAADQFNVIVKLSESFSGTAKDLSDLLKSLEIQKEQLLTLLRLLADLVRDASASVPKIEPAMITMINQITSGVTENQKRLTEVVEQSTRIAKENDQMFRTLLKDQLDAATKDLNSHIRQMSEDTKKQVVVLDKALQDELTKSIESLGKQLTALSQKFVQDYTPLTEQLRRLVTELNRR
jgi:DNA anti-recombination protein RmuC